MPPLRRGHLSEASLAPPKGETAGEVFGLHGVVIEQILSGELVAPVDHDQPHDEWVVLLDGRAELDLEGERCALVPGDWIFIPRHTPHRLVRTDPGSRWLAVRSAGEAPEEVLPPIRRAPTR
ncbi:MAG: cupin domain-containing protein [Acidimicrobiales bacterium]|jgi:cupin 2 domain-containing protein